MKVKVSAADFDSFLLIIFSIFLSSSSSSSRKVCVGLHVFSALPIPSSSLVPVRHGEEVSVSGLGAVSLPSGHSGWRRDDREDHSFKGPNWN